MSAVVNICDAHLMPAMTHHDGSSHMRATWHMPTHGIVEQNVALLTIQASGLMC